MITATAAPALSLEDLRAFDPRHKERDGETDCCCPLCGGEKPVDEAHRSFSYNTRTGLFECHRCHAKGKLTDHWEDRPQERPADRRTRARASFRRQLAVPPLRAEDAKNVDIVGLKKKIGEQHRLADTPGAAYLAGRGLPPDFCHGAGVRFAPAFAGRPAVTFPVRDQAGRLVAVQGRYIDGRDNPRMRTYGEKARGIFSTPGALEEERIVLVEAPLDALALAFAGVPAVALCGSRGVPDWLLRRMALRESIAAFDADTAGDEAAAAVAAQLVPLGGTLLRLRPQAAKDWNQALQREGGEALALWLLAQMFPKSAPVNAGADELLPDYPRHAPDSIEAVRAVLAEAERGNLPCVAHLTACLPEHLQADPNRAARWALDCARAAKQDGDGARQDRHEADLWELAAWWHWIEQQIGPGSGAITWRNPETDGGSIEDAIRMGREKCPPCTVGRMIADLDRPETESGATQPA